MTIIQVKGLKHPVRMMREGPRIIWNGDFNLDREYQVDIKLLRSMCNAGYAVPYFHHDYDRLIGWTIESRCRTADAIEHFFLRDQGLRCRVIECYQQRQLDLDRGFLILFETETDACTFRLIAA